MKTPSIYFQSGVVQTLRATYKRLLRASYTLNNAGPKFEAVGADGLGVEADQTALETELELFTDAPSIYLRSLAHELRYRVKDQFRNTVPPTAAQLYASMAELDQVCEQIDTLKNSKSELPAVVEFVLKLRQLDFSKAKRRAQRYREKSITDFDGKLPYDVAKKFAFPVVKYTDQTNSQKEHTVRLELATSKKEKARVVRLYLKHLQMTNRLAIPGALPYTGQELPSESVSIDKKIYRSTSHKALAEAYSFRALESLVVPEIEYLVNKHHYLDKYRTVVNEKGPFKVSIRRTEAGVVSMPYLELPYPQIEDLKDLAMDVKKSTNAFRLKAIWESKSPQDLVVETSNSDGSYPIGWFKKFGRDSKMFPRTYHEDLAQMEASWELTMDTLGGEAEGSFSDYYKSYEEPLDITSRQLAQKLSSYSAKYGHSSPRSKSLKQKQSELQAQMNHKYDSIVTRYGNLVEALETQKIGPHTHIVEPMEDHADPYDDYILKDEIRVKKNRDGVPLVSGNARGLASHLRKFGFGHFKMGMKFKKKIDW